MARGAILFCALLLAACRDGVEPFVPVTPTPDDGGRITFNTGHDLDPAWLPSGDSLLYAAESFPGAPPSPGVLVRLAADGGIAAVLFPALHSPAFGGPRWLAQPAASPAGDRIAYVQIARVVQPREPAADQRPCFTPEPLLDSLAIHVRALDGSDATTRPAVVGFPAAGRDRRIEAGLLGPYVQDVHPFHALFLDEQLLAFRPTWAPDGQRIAFSDGLRLLIHTLGGGTQTVPGTDDAISPAWSPSGDWIAFTRLVRTDTVRSDCDVAGPPGTRLHVRTGYPDPEPVLSLIRPDGTGLRTLGRGWDAAWSPDGATVYFRHEGRIWGVARDGGAPVPVAAADLGRAPAVSPDGRRLAFARRSIDEDFDVWVVALPR